MDKRTAQEFYADIQKIIADYWFPETFSALSHVAADLDQLAAEKYGLQLSTGLCSEHRFGVDLACRICYPEDH